MCCSTVLYSKESLSPSSGSVWDLHPCNGLMMWVEMISGGRCFRLMRSLKNPQIVAFLEEKEGVKIFAGFRQLVLCVAVEGISVFLLKEWDDTMSWKNNEGYKCFPLLFGALFCLVSK